MPEQACLARQGCLCEVAQAQLAVRQADVRQLEVRVQGQGLGLATHCCLVIVQVLMAASLDVVGCGIRRQPLQGLIEARKCLPSPLVHHAAHSQISLDVGKHGTLWKCARRILLHGSGSHHLRWDHAARQLQEALSFLQPVGTHGSRRPGEGEGTKQRVLAVVAHDDLHAQRACLEYSRQRRGQRPVDLLEMRGVNCCRALLGRAEGADDPGTCLSQALLQTAKVTARLKRRL
mmetsp:Transcript_85105/g.214554  ORF Transcript_85105/g.214554 Transcript_85105/m.214554 type:complete len:233 (-) Transcript_85105:1123-1821(-)